MGMGIMKRCALKWMFFIEKIRVRKRLGACVVNRNSGAKGALTERKLSREIRQNSGQKVGSTERRLSQDIGQNSGEIGVLTGKRLSQEIGQNSGEIGVSTGKRLSQEIGENSGEIDGSTERKLSQEIGENSGEMGRSTERKLWQETGANSGEMGGWTERKLSGEIEEDSGKMGGLTERKLSREIEEIEENSGEMGGLTERKLSQEIEEIEENSGKMVGMTDRKVSREIEEIEENSGEMGGLTENKLSQEIEELEENSDAAELPAPPVVAVCVEKNSEPAVKYALDSFLCEGGQLKLIHVRRPIVTIPTPMGNRLPIALASHDAIAAHKENVASQTLNLLRPFQEMCDSKKVQAESIVLEDLNVPKAILKYICDSGVNKLVMMSSHPLVERKPKGNDGRKLNRDDSRKLIRDDSGKLKGDDMPESIPMKASKICSVYVISKGKHTPLLPSNNTSRQNSTSSFSSEDILPSKVTGTRVLEPSETPKTTTHNENGRQNLENNTRDFEGPFILKPGTETKLERLKKEFQQTGEKYREAIAFQEAIVTNENGNQNLQNNVRDVEAKPDTETELESLKNEFQHTGEKYREAITFQEAFVAHENGNQSLENNVKGIEGPFISKTKLEKLKNEFQYTGETYREAIVANENGNESLENNRTDFEGPFISKPNAETKLERLNIDLQHTGETFRETIANENGNQSLTKDRRDFEGPFISKLGVGIKSERPKNDLQHTGKTYRESIAFQEEIIENENGNQSLENNRMDFEGPFTTNPDTETKLERVKIELQQTGETYREIIAFEDAIVANENGNQSLENNISYLEGTFITKLTKTSFFSRDIEAQLERLKIELQDTGKTYTEEIAVEEAIFEKYKGPLHELWKLEDELRELRKSEVTKDAFISADKRCKGYSIEQIDFATDFFSESFKIGGGEYRPVYKGSLDGTTVVIKVLRTDAARGRGEFQREIEVLSGIHHPNVILLLGTCPDRGCLVYEYMENGSLEDLLFHRGARASLPWYIRFRIASEIASALHFLHTAEPEPVVHHDLKPAKILLDHNFVSKVSDVELSSLIPRTASFTSTEFKNAVLAGTFCYMDPEHVRTGTVSPASNLYALGIILLQLLVAKPPIAIREKVETAIQEGYFEEILDETAGEWPLEETIEFAKLALKCTELLCRDRPDLKTFVLPKLERFKDIANAHAEHCTS